MSHKGLEKYVPATKARWRLRPQPEAWATRVSPDGSKSTSRSVDAVALSHSGLQEYAPVSDAVALRPQHKAWAARVSHKGLEGYAPVSDAVAF